MENNVYNTYVYKALDAYPYDLEETIEALNYALAYDDRSIPALILMGRVHAEVLKDYEAAKNYYAETLAVSTEAYEVYVHYINVLLWNEDISEAEKLIDFALRVKGSDKAILYLKKANLYEYKKEYKEALIYIKEAKMNTYNNDFMTIVNEEKDRIKGKIPKKKNPINK